MPIKTLHSSIEEVLSTPLPMKYRESYTVISHESIINQAKAQLTEAGFSIKKEQYKTAQAGKIASGMYHLNHNEDPEMGLMLGWSNSYNKSLRFKVAIGASVFICDNGMVRGDMASYSRKHTGEADFEMIETIHSQVSNATKYFDRLLEDRQILKQVNLTKRQQAELIGRMLIETNALTMTQIGVVLDELKAPSYDYTWDPDSAWALYNHATHALKESHPLVYLNNHEKVHSLFIDEFTKPIPISIPFGNGNFLPDINDIQVIEPEPILESVMTSETSQLIFA